jgi:hypothetical protein
MRLTQLVLFLAATVHADPKPADATSPEHKKAFELVAQLGNARFAVREAAAKQLLEMGEHAFAALIEGTESTDEEVRTRSAALLPLAKAAVWKTRANAYLADADGKQKHELPLLAEFEKAIGKDPAAKKLFAEMICEKAGLLELVVKDPKAALAEVAARCLTLAETAQPENGQAKAPLGELATLFFLHARLLPPGRNWDDHAQTAELLWNPTMSEEIGSKEFGPALRRLLAYWSENRPADDFVSQQLFGLVIRDKPFPEAASALIRLAKQETPGAGLNIRTPAIQALVAIGGKEAIATVEELVKDETTLFSHRTANGEVKITLGDQALAALVQANKKRFADYGFSNVTTVAFRAGQTTVEVTLRGFPSDEARSKAQKKWRDEAAKK